MTNPAPAHTHQAIISADAPPRPACHSSGPSTARAADVTCPACLNIAAARKARTEADVHDTHAIPAADEVEPATAEEIKPGDLFCDRDDDEWVAVSTGNETFLVNPVFLHTTKQVIEESGPLVKYLSDDEPISAVEQVKSCPSCPHCGKTFHVEDAPAKTHDLSVFRNQGKLVIAVEDETDDLRVYLPEGVDRDLGRALALLKPAQIALLIGELTSDER